MRLKTLLAAVIIAAFLIPCIFVVADEVDEPADPPEPTEVSEETEEDVEDADKPPEDVVIAIDVYDLDNGGQKLAELSATYSIHAPAMLNVYDVIKYHVDEVIERSPFTVAMSPIGGDFIKVGGDRVEIYVHPRVKSVQIIHHLLDCQDNVERQFLEEIVLNYSFVLTDETAADAAKARIERMSGRGYTFQRVVLEEDAKLPPGVKIKNLDGEEVTPEPGKTTIHVIYVHECSKTMQREIDKKVEQKVDAIQTSAMPQELPATGDKGIPDAGSMAMIGMLLFGLISCLYLIFKK